MESIKSNTRPTYPYLTIPLVSLMICMFLVYMDEGNYSLENMFDAQNIPALIIYFIGFNLVAFLIYWLMLLKFPPVLSLIAALILTLPIGFLFALVAFRIVSLFL